MDATFTHAIPVLPAADVAASLKWWTEICGFTQLFVSGEPPTYAGLKRDALVLHLARVDGEGVAITVGAQTMVRLAVHGIEDLYIEYQARGGQVHPNGALRDQPWGGRAFDAIDPCGVCVTFVES